MSKSCKSKSGRRVSKSGLHKIARYLLTQGKNRGPKYK